MSNFSLIKQLQNPTAEDEPRLPKGIRYQEYEIEPKDGTMTVFIPLKEAEAFEESLMEFNILLRADVRSLLRKHRGIMG